MKWYSIKKSKPHYNGYYLVLIHDDGEPGGDDYYDVVEWDGEEWICDWLDDHSIVTHFCPIEPIEQE